MTMPSFDPSQFDPSKMDPKLLMEISQLVRELPPDKLTRMQSLMHNMMAGFDVRSEMEEFEKTLPPGFREKMTRIMMTVGAPMPGAPATIEAEFSSTPASAPTAGPSSAMDLREARVTLLRAVADGRMSPEDAERLLFPNP
jgi:hypothetical protein